MQKSETNQLIYSATDVVDFLLCPSIIRYAILDLETPLPKAQEDEYSKILQQKGFAHETNFLNHLQGEFTKVIDIADISHNSNEAAFKNTLTAMAEGAEIIFQGFFRVENRIGHVDFLKKVAKPSRLGNYSYEIIDTKLSKTAQPKFVVQLCFYADLLKHFQGTDSDHAHLKLGDGRQVSFYLKDYYFYYKTVLSRFEDSLKNLNSHYPIPCDHCHYCVWRDLCDDLWLKDDHLSQVANITKIQTKKLEKAGITTLAALGTAPETTKISRMNADVFKALRQQAALQLKARKSGKNYYELLPVIPCAVHGFNRLPPPDGGDLYFDMEGDPLEEGGLEYLFGVYYHKKGKPVFKDFWAHDKFQEKKVFEAFIDFVWDHLKHHPQAHIYHYASYEETALKKLMSLHGTREFQVDELLRHHKLVDLYKVVKQGIKVSEPSYSIKNLEKFYMEERTADVVNAAGSIIFYEKWKLSQDQALLQAIKNYNKDDCRSTCLLHKWLLSIKPGTAAYYYDQVSESAEEVDDDRVISEYEAILAETLETLVANIPADKEQWNDDDKLLWLTGHLLDFYRRSDKPAWWGIFTRMEMTEEAVIDDAECIGGMTLTEEPRIEKRSLIYTYKFPDQEHKLREGQDCTNTQTGESLSSILHLDTHENIVQLKLGMSKPRLPDRLSIGPGRPIKNTVLREAIFRFANSLINGTGRYKAVEQILKKELPVFKGRSSGKRTINPDKDIISETIAAVGRLKQSYLSIQGPPGTGKTYTAVRIITALLQAGKRVGISSNSHKAINHLLHGIEAYALKEGVTFTGTKKCTAKNEDSYLNGKIIEDVTHNWEVTGDLVGATAWTFARGEHNQCFDYLFVDEAGQVSLANIVAMGLAAKNIVLLGDQMQLGQPVQGIHPEESGKSILDFLMAEYATVPENRGILLTKTYRMHPDVTGFISDVSYEGRLIPDKNNARQRLLLNNNWKIHLPQSGIKFIPVEHDACSQSSIEEAHTIKEMVEFLLKQSYRDKTNKIKQLTLDNILIVAPYNMQVNLLYKTLPEGSRIGTVDKFQGQEAEVVIVSMTTSSQEYLPRFIDFLYSKKRLNVALSRAKILAVLIANPQLLKVRCNTIEQMGLVNTLCWAYYKGS